MTLPLPPTFVSAQEYSSLFGQDPAGVPGNLQHGPAGTHPTILRATADKEVLLALGIRNKCTLGSVIVLLDGIDSLSNAINVSAWNSSP